MLCWTQTLEKVTFNTVCLVNILLEPYNSTTIPNDETDSSKLCESFIYNVEIMPMSFILNNHIPACPHPPELQRLPWQHSEHSMIGSSRLLALM